MDQTRNVHQVTWETLFVDVYQDIFLDQIQLLVARENVRLTQTVQLDIFAPTTDVQKSQTLAPLHPVVQTQSVQSPEMETLSADVCQATFPNQTQLLDVVESVREIKTAAVATSVRATGVCPDLTLATLHLVVPTLSVMSTDWEILFVLVSVGTHHLQTP